MAKLFQWRRGTTVEHTTFTGEEGEITVDIDKDTLVIHDGTTVGGFPMLREDVSNYNGGVFGTTVEVDKLRLTDHGSNSQMWVIEEDSGSPTNAITFEYSGSEKLRLAPNGLITSIGGANFGDSVVIDRTGDAGNLSVGSDIAVDEVGLLSFFGHNNAGSNTSYAEIAGFVLDPTTGDEDGRLEFLILDDGVRICKASISKIGLGIGIVNPSYLLHVHTASAGSVTASTNFDEIVAENNGNAGITILSGNTNLGAIVFGDEDDSNKGQVRYDHNDDSLALYTNGFDRLHIESGGNIGIGTTSPDAKLDVNGDFRADNYANRNIIINGSMNIWQRGTSFTPTTLAYTADRWFGWSGGNDSGKTYTRQTGRHGAGSFNIRIKRDSGQTWTSSLAAGQAFESSDSTYLDNQEITLSFYARAGADFSATDSILTSRIHTGQGTNQSALNMINNSWTTPVSNSQDNTITTGWLQFRHTFTVASISQAGVVFFYTPTGTAGSSDWFEIMEVQLEIGGVATEFERKHVADELATCKRYFEKLNPSGSVYRFANGMLVSATVARGVITHEEKRVTPTLSLGTSTASHFGVVNASGVVIPGTTLLSFNTLDVATVQYQQIASTLGGAGGNATILAANSNSTAQILIDAEL